MHFFLFSFSSTLKFKTLGGAGGEVRKKGKKCGGDDGGADVEVMTPVFCILIVLHCSTM